MKDLKEIIDLLENAKEIITVEAIVGDDGLCNFTPTMQKAEKDINKAFFFLHSFTDEAMKKEGKYICFEINKISEKLKRSPFDFRSVMTSFKDVIIDLKEINNKGV